MGQLEVFGRVPMPAGDTLANRHTLFGSTHSRYRARYVLVYSLA